MGATSFDVIIVGGGMVGLTLACALAQATPLSVAVLDSKHSSDGWSVGEYHHRVSAFALSSRRIFQSLKAWDIMQGWRVSPFNSIQVWDGVLEGEIHFDSKEISESTLGYIIENAVVQTALMQRIKHFPQVSYLAPVELVGLRKDKQGVELKLADDHLLLGKLLVAADGAHSWVRQQLGMAVEKIDYEQQAIVATVKTQLPHSKCARQIFLPTGPLAFLPLNETHTSSIVWSLPTSQAKQMQALSDEEFKRELADAFSHRLGKVIKISSRYTYPLSMQVATQYVQENVALVGDAAHTVHPLAGQGANMGLLDAASLADVVANALQQKRNFSALHTLRRYERWRKAENSTMQFGIDTIKSLFANQSKSLQIMRSLGLNSVNHLPLIKNTFTRHAVGNKGDLPSLAKITID